MDLGVIGVLSQHYTASQPRRPRFEAFISMRASDLVICYFAVVSI